MSGSRTEYAMSKPSEAAAEEEKQEGGDGEATCTHSHRRAATSVVAAITAHTRMPRHSGSGDFQRSRTVLAQVSYSGKDCILRSALATLFFGK